MAENDVERSWHIRQLVGSTAALGGLEPTPRGASEIPRVVLQYWHSAKRIPDDVDRCMATWKSLQDASFDHLLFDDESARDFIQWNLGADHLAAFEQCAHPAMRCDLFRLCYLVAEGGFYVDADDVYLGVGVEHLLADDRLKLQPLCYDSLTREMVKLSELLATHSSPSHWIYYVNNNPLVAPPGHPVLIRALDRATQLLLRNAPAEARDIQSMTGPGNLSASLVAHHLSLGDADGLDFVLLEDWEQTSTTEWDLGYRSDDRNWRRWARSSSDHLRVD